MRGNKSIYRRLHKLSPLLKLTQCFSKRWILWDPPATRPTFFAVYSHWCTSVVALARGFSIKASRHLLRSSSCLIRARLWDGGKPRLNGPRFQPIAAEGHAVRDLVNFDFSWSYLHLLQVGKRSWKQFKSLHWTIDPWELTQHQTLQLAPRYVITCREEKKANFWQNSL